VIVVDPGVGGERRVLCLKKEGHFFLAPDNGILTTLVDDPEMVRSVEDRSLFLPEVSNTFHGRDIFAPVAAGLANGDIDPEKVGPPVNNPMTVPWSEPTCTHQTLEGSVVYIDVFGNLVTNVTRTQIEKLEKGNPPRVFLCGREIGVPQPSYSRKSKGSPLAIIGSFGHLEIAINEGNAAEYYCVGTGGEVIVTTRDLKDG
jgi:S-adenosylmethionine hydrolase